MLPLLTLAVLAPPANVPLTPLPGAVNTTDTPVMGLPPLSVTVACSATGNDVFTAVLCEFPPDATMFTGAPVVFVKLKFAVPVTPDALAVTV